VNRLGNVMELYTVWRVVTLHVRPYILIMASCFSPVCIVLVQFSKNLSHFAHTFLQESSIQGGSN